MSKTFVIAGTDTGVGKTVFAAALVGALGGFYWKPVQAGFEDGGDIETVHQLSGLPRENLLPETYRLRSPMSPHRAAELDSIEIVVDRLMPPASTRPMLVELAGGLMVPLTRTCLQIDLLPRWNLPVVLVARTALGTINHSLLSIEALKRRGVSILGIAFVGDAKPDSEATISEMGEVKRLGRLPLVTPLNCVGLKAAFEQNFDLRDFA